MIEAKKNDFEQGATQCLVEMHPCQWVNRQIGQDLDLDIYGIVTNGEGSQLYRLACSGEASESLLHGIGDLSIFWGY